jgi:translocation and assembly module TamA
MNIGNALNSGFIKIFNTAVRKRVFSILFIAFISCIYISVSYVNSVFAKTESARNLNIITKTNIILPCAKELDELVKLIQDNAVIYGTSNKYNYWKTEGKILILKLLHSNGYYDAQIESELVTNDKNTSILFNIYAYERYKISEINIVNKGGNSSVIIPSLEQLEIKVGDYAVAKKIIHAQQKIYQLIEKNNCLLKLSVMQEVVLDHIDDNVQITFIIKAGPSAMIKSLDFKGLTSINPEYVRKIIKIENDVCFKQSIIEQAKVNLTKSGLFASAKAVIPLEVSSDGTVPVIFEVKERHHRSLTAGINYSIGMGIGLTTSWNHRNFNSNGEELKTGITANHKEQLFNTSYVMPFFLQDNQELHLDSAIKNTESKAFDSRELFVYGGIERNLSDIDTVGAGIKYSIAKVKEINVKQYPVILSLPLFSIRDTRDNKLNSHDGYLVKADLEPSFNMRQNKALFVKGLITGSTYLAIDDNENAVLAIRSQIGSILGIKTSKLSATERFYSGGANSIRGYDYQLAEDFKNKKPRGGIALFESTVEIRKKIKDNLGIVAFFDTGRTYDGFLPNFNKKLYSGVGIGGRYYTDFAPLRIDIAVPLNRRKGVDRSFQFYFGIGQSF